jgi:hypothetical protein
LVDFENVASMEPRNFVGDNLSRVTPILPVTQYNIACCYSMLDQVGLGVEAGFVNSHPAAGICILGRDAGGRALCMEQEESCRRGKQQQYICEVAGYEVRQGALTA